MEEFDHLIPADDDDYYGWDDYDPYYDEDFYL